MLVRTRTTNNQFLLQSTVIGAVQHWTYQKIRNQKHHLQGNGIPQDIVTRMPITRAELLTISIVTIRSILHNSGRFFWVLDNFCCEFCGKTFSAL